MNIFLLKNGVIVVMRIITDGWREDKEKSFMGFVPNTKHTGYLTSIDLAMLAEN